MVVTEARIDIDYSRYGRSQRITVPLFQAERTVEVGERVQVTGDDVPDRAARVAALLDGGRKAVLEFEDSVP